ncbi:hypothetical protein [Streptomyces antimicrobicus]|nr:hypothetical protein [Streptomyces antimicrobicus]
MNEGIREELPGDEGEWYDADDCDDHYFDSPAWRAPALETSA